jgi:hypothetical protein
VGVLEFVDNTVDRATGTIKLKAVFTNTQRRLWPGQFINVALTMTTQSDAVVIPSEAVQVGQEGQHVFVVKPDKTVEVRSVTIGTTSEGEAVIAKGLIPGEQIVREGQFLLGPGSRIEVKDSTKVAEESKGEGRQGRGNPENDKGTGRGAGEKKGEERKSRGGSDGAAVAENHTESTRGLVEIKDQASRKRQGQGRSKAEVEAKG